ncbi:catenin delta-1-like isoform X1 [Bufo gargarizans]|uniref:catenin delta-1-like isoform X1 n=2 Tax=Bufo gargarizans TaxID=30331 RepID=UPI001CF3AF7A|nr:catenin delta-1-like isoform X1 [Bufo gargarizans]XP_044153324.1 catenin delta-1-like isoform X1 [Bufo gargarizans]
MDEPESESPASILASVRAQEAQFELLSRALEEERRHVTAQLDRVWVTPQEATTPLSNGTLTRFQQNRRVTDSTEGQRKKYPDIKAIQDHSPCVYSSVRMENNGRTADENYVLDDEPLYLSYSMSEEPRHMDIPIKPSVGYSQTLDRPYRDAVVAGGAYTTVPRNYHFRGPGTEPLPVILPPQHPGYSSLSRPNNRYHTLEPYRGPGYGPQPQVRGAGFGGSQSDLLTARYGSEDAYGLEDDRRSLGGYVDGPDYSTTGRRTANGDQRRRLRSYEDPLSDHYGSSLPQSGSLSSLGPASLTVAPSGPWRQPELPEVLAMLSYTLDAVRLNAAAYLQHLSYRNEEVKKEVCRLRGIPPLISLLEDPRAPVRLAACGALKNLSYGPAKENKLAVKNCDGVPALARQLRRRGEGQEGREMAECVTGTLWNLSSLDSIKMELVDQALYTLIQEILVPYSGWQKDGGAVNAEEGKTQHIEWEPALVNTTGCLRNISSERSEARRKMRESEGLVDSVVHILRSEVGHGQTDSKLVENVVCLLRNLSYHIHREIPQAEKYQENHLTENTEPQNPSCFGVRRGKGKKISDDSADSVEFPKRTTPAVGYELLFQPEMVRLYVSLVKLSRTPAVLEAAAGAIQNLCAGCWIYGRCIRAAVRQEKGLSSLADHLSHESERVVRAICGALRNLCGDSRNRELIGKHALSNLVARLPSSQSPVVSEDTTVAILSTIQEVITGNLEASKKLRESQGIERLVLINKGGGRSDREIRGAGLCLQTVWGFKELRRPLEKEGWKRSDFQVSFAGSKRAPGFDDSTLPLIDRAQRIDPYSHNGDHGSHHLNRSKNLSELEPLKARSLSAGGSLDLGDAEDQPV